VKPVKDIAAPPELAKLRDSRHRTRYTFPSVCPGLEVRSSISLGNGLAGAHLPFGSLSLICKGNPLRREKTVLSFLRSLAKLVSFLLVAAGVAFSQQPAT
jgi:hypothetical protein